MSNKAGAPHDRPELRYFWPPLAKNGDCALNREPSARQAYFAEGAAKAVATTLIAKIRNRGRPNTGMREPRLRATVHHRTSLYLAEPICEALRKIAFEERLKIRDWNFGLCDAANCAVCLYKEHLVGAWRWVYVIAAIASLYFNVFVLVVQSFVKVSALTALAPTQTEPPFAFTQAVVLAIFV